MSGPRFAWQKSRRTYGEGEIICPKKTVRIKSIPWIKWVSIEQAANYLGVSVVTVRSWLREKRGIPAVKIGKQWKFRLSDLEKWVTSGGSQFGSDKEEE